MGQMSPQITTSATTGEAFTEYNQGYGNNQCWAVTSGSSWGGGSSFFGPQGQGSNRNAASLGSNTAIAVISNEPSGAQYKTSTLGSWTVRTDWPISSTPANRSAIGNYNFSRAYFAAGSSTSAVYYVTSVTGGWISATGIPFGPYNMYFGNHNNTFTYYVGGFDSTGTDKAIYMYDGSASTLIGYKSNSGGSAFGSRGSTIYQVGGTVGTGTLAATIS
jgi:hypothetical protein